jgi:hypothetical protein
MAEYDWSTCTDPQVMALSLERWYESVGRANELRKPRLLACASARTVWNFLGDERSQRAVIVSERYADGLATLTELVEAHDAAREAIRGAPSRAAYWTADDHGWQAARITLPTAIEGAAEAMGQTAIPSRRRLHCDLLRDIFGNPFRPVAVDPAWLAWNGGTVPAIARRVYDDRAFHDLPILADALEDAGCDSPDVLAHCRGDGPHVRGCWVVDHVLGKA